MVRQTTKRLGSTAQAGLVGLLTGLGVLGCGGGKQAGDITQHAATPKDSQPSPTNDIPAPLDPRLHQTFADATRADPPADWQRPPDLTLTGKSVGKLYTEVVNQWESIRFTSKAGKPIHYTATLETDLGEIQIALRPDLAPNHVRNFVALALVGYYDGLVFERTVHARSDEHPDQEVEIIEAGCPLGTGDSGFGSIGYWLKSEFSKEPHEEGTLAAAHGEELDTAACRFYFTLNKAPFLDGNFTVFGKVTQGLDVARRIFSLPVRNDPEYPEGDRPEKPVVIRKVTIHTVEGGS
jgi:cyclophilin family peptidyl-prolyl cis-trans isomerase